MRHDRPARILRTVLALSLLAPVGALAARDPKADADLLEDEP